MVPPAYWYTYIDVDAQYLSQIAIENAVGSWKFACASPNHREDGVESRKKSQPRGPI